MRVVAVTSITGKTGYWFYQKVLREAESLQGTSFRVASRSSNVLNEMGANGLLVEPCIGDINDSEFCQKLCKGVDTLIHIAGIRQSFPLLDVAAGCGVKWFILVHTTGMFSKYKKAAKPYIDIEKRIDALARANDIAVTILRPTMIYGTLDDKITPPLSKWWTRCACFL